MLGQCLGAYEAGGSGREELKRLPPPSTIVLWIVNVREKKPIKKNFINIFYKPIGIDLSRQTSASIP